MAEERERAKVQQALTVLLEDDTLNADAKKRQMDILIYSHKALDAADYKRIRQHETLYVELWQYVCSLIQQMCPAAAVDTSLYLSTNIHSVMFAVLFIGLLEFTAMLDTGSCSTLLDYDDGMAIAEEQGFEFDEDPAANITTSGIARGTGIVTCGYKDTLTVTTPDGYSFLLHQVYLVKQPDVKLLIGMKTFVMEISNLKCKTFEMVVTPSDHVNSKICEKLNRKFAESWKNLPKEKIEKKQKQFTIQLLPDYETDSEAALTRRMYVLRWRQTERAVGRDLSALQWKAERPLALALPNAAERSLHRSVSELQLDRFSQLAAADDDDEDELANRSTGKDGKWCRGVVLVCQTLDKDNSGENRFAWCEHFQLCQFLPSATVQQLIIGGWYRFLILPDPSNSGFFVVNAEDAQPIPPLWPTIPFDVPNYVTILVRSVLAVLVSRTEMGTAIAFSPFFQRIHVPAASIVHFDQLSSGSKLTPPAILRLDIAKVQLVAGSSCEWKATHICKRWNATEEKLTQLGVRKLACQYMSVERDEGLYWLQNVDQHSEMICFGDGDFFSATVPPLSFNQGDRFTAWIGGRPSLNGHPRAFFVVREDDSSAQPSMQ